MAYTTINKSGDYFNTKLYTGNGGTQGITGVGFKPDLNWIKDRDGTPSHVLHDIIRGVTKRLMSNNTNAEDTGSQINSFDTDGFTVPNNNNNTNGNDYVSWNWLGSNTTASNSNGSITSTVSFNTTSGFSIVKWSGTGATATVGHGLGVAPSVVIVKQLTGTGAWYSYFKPLGNGNAVVLNATDASSSTGIWNNTSPTNQVFSVINNPVVNASGSTYIAYCFAEKQGYSKFGSYTGNGSTDGTFVYTGFKPAFVITKASSTAQSWQMSDNKRDTFNAVDHRLQPNESSAEATSLEWIDFCSNGFKLRNNDVAWNGSGQTYIYMAFASAPLVGSNNVPCTAR